MPIQPTALSSAVTKTLSRTAALINLSGPHLARSESCELAALDNCSELEKIFSIALQEPFQCERGGARISHHLWVPATKKIFVSAEGLEYHTPCGCPKPMA
jgi:hypothetical protein